MLFRSHGYRRKRDVRRRHEERQRRTDPYAAQPLARTSKDLRQHGERQRRSILRRRDTAQEGLHADGRIPRDRDGSVTEHAFHHIQAFTL